MIDYDKLRIAHELCIGTPYYFDIALGVDDGLIALFDSELNVSFIDNYNGLDNLIANLQTLTQPKAKYEVGDKCWCYIHGSMYECKIQQIYWDNDLKNYRTNLIRDGAPVGKISCSQSEVYPTKSALIESQIEYWENMRAREYENEVTEECQHEPEMDIGKDCRPRFEKGNNPKCKHCGELYSVECQHEFSTKYPIGFGDYWKCGVCEEYIRECQHESDGCRYIDDVAQSKCLKCGEFYK